MPLFRFYSLNVLIGFGLSRFVLPVGYKARFSRWSKESEEEKKKHEQNNGEYTVSEKRSLGEGYEPRCEKTRLRGFRSGPTQTMLYNHRG